MGTNRDVPTENCGADPRLARCQAEAGDPRIRCMHKLRYGRPRMSFATLRNRRLGLVGLIGLKSVKQKQRREWGYISHVAGREVRLCRPKRGYTQKAVSAGSRPALWPTQRDPYSVTERVHLLTCAMGSHSRIHSTSRVLQPQCKRHVNSRQMCGLVESKLLGLILSQPPFLTTPDDLPSLNSARPGSPSILSATFPFSVQSTR